MPERGNYRQLRSEKRAIVIVELWAAIQMQDETRENDGVWLAIR